MKKRVVFLLAAVLLVLTGCFQKIDGDGMVYQSYRQISQDQAKEMMAQDDGHVVVDVRRQDEYDAGHIPGAILIPNESIGTEQPEELPDLNQIILIYCRSGNRSKDASQKLFDMGYTNIYEFGGIIDWTGEIVTSQKEAGGSAGEQQETEEKAPEGKSETVIETPVQGETASDTGDTAQEAEEEKPETGETKSESETATPQAEETIPEAAEETPESETTAPETEETSPAKLLYMGHASIRITTAEGRVIYIDPFAGDGYEPAADLILVTHGHYDHTAVDKVENRSPDCQIITWKEALADGKHQKFDLGYVQVEAVEAGYNSNHDKSECVGFVLTFSDGVSVYVTGDTSKTEQMPQLAEKEIDYAFFCCDGVYNMDLEEAAECAALVKAKHNIPYHIIPASGVYFDRERAEQFPAENRLIVDEGEEIELVK